MRLYFHQLRQDSWLSSQHHHLPSLRYTRVRSAYREAEDTSFTSEPLVWPGRGYNPQPTDREAGTLYPYAMSSVGNRVVNSRIAVTRLMRPCFPMRMSPLLFLFASGHLFDCPTDVETFCLHTDCRSGMWIYRSDCYEDEQNMRYFINSNLIERCP